MSRNTYDEYELYGRCYHGKDPNDCIRCDEESIDRELERKIHGPEPRLYFVRYVSRALAGKIVTTGNLTLRGAKTWRGMLSTLTPRIIRLMPVHVGAGALFESECGGCGLRFRQEAGLRYRTTRRRATQPSQSGPRGQVLPQEGPGGPAPRGTPVPEDEGALAALLEEKD